MNEQELKNKEIEEREVSAQEDINTIDANFINEIKKNTVSKDEYNKLKKRYEDVVRNNIENRNIDEDNKPVKEVDYKKQLKETQEKLFNGKIKMTNLETAKTVLDYRDACIHETGKDPFIQLQEGEINYNPKTKEDEVSVVPHIPSQEEIDQAERVATGLKKMVDEANNDPDEFNRLYSRDVRGINC